MQVVPAPSVDPDLLLERLQESVGQGKFTGKGDCEMVMGQLRMLDWIMKRGLEQAADGDGVSLWELLPFCLRWRRADAAGDAKPVATEVSAEPSGALHVVEGGEEGSWMRSALGRVREGGGELGSVKV